MDSAAQRRWQNKVYPNELKSWFLAAPNIRLNNDLFAVNHEVKELLHTLPSDAEKKKIFLATHFAQHHQNQEVLDPFYLGPHAFDSVMEMAFDACKGILDHLFP